MAKTIDRYVGKFSIFGIRSEWYKKESNDIHGKSGLVDEAQRVSNRIAQPSTLAFSAMSKISIS